MWNKTMAELMSYVGNHGTSNRIKELTHYRNNFIEDKILDENEKSFNQTVIYGRDIDGKTIASEAKRYPMMSEHTVVIVKEAQDTKKIEEILSYVENPLKSTLLVICYKYKTPDKRTGI